MVESAAHLVDHVFPEVPVRQWELTFPFPLGYLFATQPEALTQVLAVVQPSISSFVIRRSGLTLASGARTGARYPDPALRFCPQPQRPPAPWYGGSQTPIRDQCTATETCLNSEKGSEWFLV